MPRVLLFFVDGVGIGPADDRINPFLRARLPVLSKLLGGIPTLGWLSDSGARRSVPTDEHPASRDIRLLPLDATLGVDGLPQSGTGQISLLTGRNAARMFGRHFGPWPPVRLRPLLARENVLVRAQEAGLQVTFANAYPRGYPEKRSGRLVAAPPLAARAAGLLTRHQQALAAGEAVASEIVNDGWRRMLGPHRIPEVTPREAGSILARLAGEADLTLFAHYSTDLAGHRGGMAGAVKALERVDRFLGGVLAALPADVLFLLVSDHGNLEDVRGGHTRNPALGLAAEPLAEHFSARPDLTHIAPLVLKILGA